MSSERITFQPFTVNEGFALCAGLTAGFAAAIPLAVHEPAHNRQATHTIKAINSELTHNEALLDRLGSAPSADQEAIRKFIKQDAQQLIMQQKAAYGRITPKNPYVAAGEVLGLPLLSAALLVGICSQVRRIKNNRQVRAARKLTALETAVDSTSAPEPEQLDPAALETFHANLKRYLKDK